MIWYYLFLSVLFIVYFFFAYDLSIEVEIDFNHLKIKVFKIPIFIKRDEKYYNLLKKLIPKDQNQIKEEIDMSSLITLTHIKDLSITVSKNINDYLNYIYLLEGCNMINHALIPLLKEYIEHYKFSVNSSSKNNLLIKSIISFNLGIILLNMLMIKRRYAGERKTN